MDNSAGYEIRTEGRTPIVPRHESIVSLITSGRALTISNHSNFRGVRNGGAEVHRSLSQRELGYRYHA